MPEYIVVVRHIESCEVVIVVQAEDHDDARKKALDVARELYVDDDFGPKTREDSVERISKRG